MVCIPFCLTNTYVQTDGRAGGHLRPDLYSATSTYTERYGIVAAVEVVRFEISHMKILDELVRKEKIDCDLTFSRSYDIYLDADQLANAKKFYDFLVEQGLDFMDDVKYLSQEEAQGVSRSVPQNVTFASTDSTLEKTAKVRNAQGGFSFSAGHLWPYKLVAGLIRVAVSRGLNLQSKTMVTEIGKTRTPEGLWPVTTGRGVIYARKIILATNAFTSALAPEYSKAIVPCKGLCTQLQTAPGAPYQKLPETYAIRHGPGAFIYQISRKDGSIIVGGAQYTYRDEPDQWYNNTDDGTLIQNVEHYFDGYMQRTFFGWEDSQATVKHIWTGGKQSISPLHIQCAFAICFTNPLSPAITVMGYSADSLPHIGAIPGKPGQFIAAGFNGHGMPVIFLCGKAIAQMAQESISFQETGLPQLFETSAARLDPVYNDTIG